MAVTRPTHQARSKQKVGLEMGTDNARYQAELSLTVNCPEPDGIRALPNVRITRYT